MEKGDRKTESKAKVIWARRKRVSAAAHTSPSGSAPFCFAFCGFVFCLKCYKTGLVWRREAAPLVQDKDRLTVNSSTQFHLVPSGSAIIVLIVAFCELIYRQMKLIIKQY